jgi:hypothetical protein
MFHSRRRTWHLGLALVFVLLFGASLASLGGCQNPVEPVGSVAVQFASSVTYDQALRIIVDLGLAPVQPCGNFDADWAPVGGTDEGQHSEQWSADSSELLASARDISAPDWLKGATSRTPPRWDTRSLASRSWPACRRRRV